MQEESAQCLTIGEVAAEAGLRTSAIRYYESVGLLPEPERVSGQRRYSREVLALLGFIEIGRRAGFSLEEIRELIDGAAADEASRHLQEIAQRKLPDVEALISRAEAMKTWLETTAHCGCATFDACALFGEDASRALDSDPQLPQLSPARAGPR
jgi:MerR family transcriptional regulator, redox-sensitive transcriptional activator SoxR